MAQLPRALWKVDSPESQAESTRLFLQIPSERLSAWILWKNHFSLEKGLGGDLPWWPGDKMKRISAPEQRRSRCMPTCGFVWFCLGPAGGSG